MKKCFKIVVLLGIIHSFASLCVFAQEQSQPSPEPPKEDELAYVVMGYRSLFDVPDMKTVAPEKQKDVQALIRAQVQSRLAAVHAAILDWRMKTSFNPQLISRNGEIEPVAYLKSETQVHFLILPIVFEGSRKNLAEAIRLLDNQEVSNGKFKVEEVRENTYALQCDFGYWDKATQDLKVLKVYTVSETVPFLTVDETVSRRQEELKNLINLYKQSKTYENKELRHMVKLTFIHSGFVSPTWVQDGFVAPRFLIQNASSLPDGRVPMIIAVQQDSLEL